MVEPSWMVMIATHVTVPLDLLETNVKLTQMNVNQNLVRTMELAKMESTSTHVTVRWRTRVTIVTTLMNAPQVLVRTMELAKMV